VGTPPSPLLSPVAAGPSDAGGRSLLDSLGEACVALDPDGRVLYCNPAYAALVGVPVADLLGRPLAVALPEFAGSPCERACGRALETGSPQEAEGARGGRFFHYRAYPTPRGVVILVADATARRQFEEELVQCVLRDRLLLEQLPAVHWTTDRDLRFTSSCGAALRHLGLRPGEVVGRTLYDVLGAPDGNCFPIRMHRQALAGERVRYSWAHAGRHYDTVLEPLRDHARRVAGVIGLAHDVTELQRATEEQRRLQEEVFQAQKLESLGLLAAGLAHDFNNLLVGMLTAADLLRRDLAPGSEEHSLAELIKKAGERAAGLTRQMLVYAGKGKPERRPLDLNTAVEEGLALLTAGLPGNVMVIKVLDPHLPPIAADPAQVQQIVTNLVLNAGEALGAKGGRVLLVTGVEAADGNGASSPSTVYLDVTDDGCGMAADVLRRICDPFFTTKGKGRGFGLSSVQGMVRAHGGALRATSTPGAGTTVRVLLPAAAPDTPPRSAEPSGESRRPPGGQVVLLIDDEPVVRGVITRALGRLGLQVLGAGSRDGLELFHARRETIDLVLLDLGLPGQDARPTLAALRAARPDVRVVLTSGANPNPVPHQAGPEPPVAFLAKPYTVHALIEVVIRALADTPA
jgi:PAS domain S-box-containing protein